MIQPTFTIRQLLIGLVIPFVLFSFVLFSFVLSSCASAHNEFSNHPSLPCKYSVRDVGFVDVHGPTWQLRLLKPALEANEFESLAGHVAKILDRSNVGHLWLAANAEEAKQILASTEEQGVWGELLSPDGKKTPLSGLPNFDASDHIKRTVESLVQSENRNRLLMESSKRLCVVWVVESTNEEKNRLASQAADRAVATLEKQMWTLEKAVERPPIKIQITREQFEADLGLKLSFPNEDEPSVAIIYGQGRILGDVLSGSNIDGKKIVNLASITGRDCECDLDRQWLYGKQILHRWSLELERAAETTLNFDPHSNIVKAEVAQIIRKTGTRKDDSGFDSVNLGSGLVIHDLDALEKKSERQNSVNDGDSKSQKPNNVREEASNLEPTAGEDEVFMKSGDSKNSPETEASRFNFPWAMVGTVAILLVLTAAFFWLRIQGS